MNWLLSLFQQYRELQRLLREEADRASKLQDQNDALLKQNGELHHALRVSESDKDHALKSVANVFAQLNGHLPPYREAYTIEKRPDAATGPVPTNRMYARDGVRDGIRQFRESLGFGSQETEAAVEID
jgi:hypothetical protein